MPSPRIICLGLTPAIQRTMVFDRFTQDAVNRARESHESPAGKSVNVARVLRVLGADCLALGFAGGDTGGNLLRYLDASNVPHDFVRVEPRTRVCTTIIDRATRHTTELVEESADVSPEAVAEVLKKLDEHLPRAAMFVLSGSLTPGAPTDFYRTCVESAKRCSVPVIVDAQGTSLVSAMESGILLAKPNRAELAATVNAPVATDAELKQAMLRLTKLGTRYVVTTMGPDGAAATDGQSFWKLTIPTVDVLNPIGSGDAFTAGLALALVQGQAFRDAFRLGAACATANVSTLRSAEVHPADVAKLLAQVSVTPF